jgi:predicted ATPase
MKIVNLQVEGFRSLKSQSWSPGDLNVLIGPNASGKSNLLRVLELLNSAAQGGMSKYIQEEGGMEPIVWDGRTNQIRLRIKTSPLASWMDLETGASTYDYELDLGRLGDSSAYRIDRELLVRLSRFQEGEAPHPSKLFERDLLHTFVYSHENNSIELPTRYGAEDESILAIAPGLVPTNSKIYEYQRELASWRMHQYFDTRREAPIRAPQITRLEKQVDPDGQNLVSVLHTLYSTDRDFKEEIRTAMLAAFGEDFHEIVFPPAADQRIQLRIRWRSLKREQSAADLSDGTLRFLFLLTILAHPSPPPLIAIDEPEIGLHPSMLSIIAEYAREASSRTQVILTTHSPEFLDAFGEEVPTTTVVERRDGETQLRVVSGDELTHWLKQYTLGELYRSKELEAMR